MGRVGNILDIEQNSTDGTHTTDIKIDVGGGEVIRAPQAAPAGIDCTPLTTDKAITSSAPGDSGQNVVGYVDPKNPSKSDGVYLYSRSADGSPVADVWLKSDGSVVVTTSGATIEATAAGAVTVEGASGGKIAIEVTGAVSMTNAAGFILLDASGVASLNGKLSVAAG